MIEQILDRFARLERSRRRWQLVSLTLAVVLVVSLAVAGFEILYLRQVAVVQIRRADRLEQEVPRMAEQEGCEAAAGKDGKEQGEMVCPEPGAHP